MINIIVEDVLKIVKLPMLKRAKAGKAETVDNLVSAVSRPPIDMLSRAIDNYTRKQKDKSIKKARKIFRGSGRQKLSIVGSG